MRKASLSILPGQSSPSNIWPKYLILLLLTSGSLHAQTCLSAADMPDTTRTALEGAARRYFDMSAQGDAAALKQNSISSLAANFSGVEGALKDNQPALAGATASVRPPFLLTAEGQQPLSRAEFLCGVFGPSGQTTHSAVFVLNNLPPGKYGVTIIDASGAKKPLTLTFILQQVGSDWKLAGYYSRSLQASGHDSAWFAQQARDFKSKSQNHNAWLYFREAIALASPVDFMSTQATDKLYDEVQSVQPADMPADGKTFDLAAGGKTYRWTAIFPLAVSDDLDVVVKYSAADISNTPKTFEENMQVIKAVVAKFPELKTAFAGVVARAVAPSGEDYGSLLPMKEIK
ncbi:MAG: hypothetical protein WBS24_08510 [Terriglobales bacterium]